MAFTMPAAVAGCWQREPPAPAPQPAWVQGRYSFHVCSPLTNRSAGTFVAYKCSIFSASLAHLIFYHRPAGITCFGETLFIR